jgi:hypothetical protein
MANQNLQIVNIVFDLCKAYVSRSPDVYIEKLRFIELALGEIKRKFSEDRTNDELKVLLKGAEEVINSCLKDLRLNQETFAQTCKSPSTLSAFDLYKKLGALLKDENVIKGQALIMLDNHMKNGLLLAIKKTKFSNIGIIAHIPYSGFLAEKYKSFPMNENFMELDPARLLSRMTF